MSLNDKIKSINDLPIYNDEKSMRQVALVNVKVEKNQLEQAITTVRQATFDFLNKYQEQKEKSLQFYDSTKKDVNEMLGYLRQESVVLPKVAFISLSGFGGLLLGFRRSSFRKILYSGALTTTATALCFPNQTKVYANQASQYAKENAEKIYRTYIWPTEEPKKTVSKEPIENEKKTVVKKNSETVVANGKDQIIKLDGAEGNSKRVLEGDIGQANLDDQDMYTTRGKK